MVVDLTAAGLVQGELWDSSAPWMDSVRASQGYWWVRVASAVPLILGFGSFLAGMLTRTRNRSGAPSRAILNMSANMSVPVPHAAHD